MRQYITTEQLNSYLELQIENGIANLGFDKQRKLNKLLGIDNERSYAPNHLFTIGKMIEILTNSEFGFPNIGLSESRYKSESIVVHILSLNGGKHHGQSFEGADLVDALWKAIKEVIS